MRQQLLWFASRIAQRITADCQYLRSSSSFVIVHVQYCVVDGSGLLIPTLVNSFPYCLHAVLLSGWQRIAHSSAR